MAYSVWCARISPLVRSSAQILFIGFLLTTAIPSLSSLPEAFRFLSFCLTYIPKKIMRLITLFAILGATLTAAMPTATESADDGLDAGA
jgi:hypothetical protein